jgi:hypothetical protein
VGARHRWKRPFDLPILDQWKPNAGHQARLEAEAQRKL